MTFVGKLSTCDAVQRLRLEDAVLTCKSGTSFQGCDVGDAAVDVWCRPSNDLQARFVVVNGVEEGAPLLNGIVSEVVADVDGLKGTIVTFGEDLFLETPLNLWAIQDCFLE